MYKLLKTNGRAKRGEFHTPHGVIQTPVFMNVGTSAAIKGGISSEDLEEVHCQVELSNTYHLHVRPGDQLIRDLGGARNFMRWNKPMLTDSGGFQVFSLGSLRKIKEEGVYFSSHVDGRKIFMGPEESMQIQSNLASTIAMAFDECIGLPAERPYVEASVARTTRWLERCKVEMTRLNGLDETLNKEQMLFGINQGVLMVTFVSNMLRCFLIWIWMVMQLAVWLLGNPMQKCTKFWKMWFHICHKINQLI